MIALGIGLGVGLVALAVAWAIVGVAKADALKAPPEVVTSLDETASLLVAVVPRLFDFPVGETTPEGLIRALEERDGEVVRFVLRYVRGQRSEAP